MKFLLLFLFIFNFYSENKLDYNGCGYDGRVLKVLYDRESNSFNSVNIQLGETLCFIEIESCKSINKNNFQLDGFIKTPIPKNGELTSGLPNTMIVKCLKKDKNFILKDTLSFSDKNGYFSIKTSKNRNEYLIIKQDSVKGVCYEMQKFIKTRKKNI